MDKDDNIFLISLTEKKVLVPAITKLQENAQCAQTRNEESASETRRVMRKMRHKPCERVAVQATYKLKTRYTVIKLV